MCVLLTIHVTPHLTLLMARRCHADRCLTKREACELYSNAQAHQEACELYAAQAHWEASPLTSMVAHCRITGSDKTLEVRTLGCARRSLSPWLTLSPRSQSSARRTQRTRDTRVYTSSGHRCVVIPHSSVVWWFAL